MAQAKTEAFDPALVRTACLAKALSHPVRIRILEILAGGKGCVCGGLVELLPLAQSTVSQHLRELQDAGLIRGDVDGPRICYCLNAEAIADSWAAFKDMFHRICGSAGEIPKSPRSGTCAFPARRTGRCGRRSSVHERTPGKIKKP